MCAGLVALGVALALDPAPDVTGVGAVTENDVLLASTSDALVIAFRVGVNAKARQAAEIAKSEVFDDLKTPCPKCGAAQLKQTPNGSRMYGVWLEEGDKGSDILFRRVDYRNAPEE